MSLFTMKMRKSRSFLIKTSNLLLLSGAHAAFGTHLLLEYWQNGAPFIQKVPPPPSSEKMSFYVNPLCLYDAEPGICRLTYDYEQKSDPFEIFRFRCHGYFNYLFSLVPDNQSPTHKLIDQTFKTTLHLSLQLHEIIKSYLENLSHMPAAACIRRDLDKINLRLNQTIQAQSPVVFLNTAQAQPKPLSRESLKDSLNSLSQVDAIFNVLDGPWELNLHAKDQISTYLLSLPKTRAIAQILEEEIEDREADIQAFLSSFRHKERRLLYNKLNQAYLSSHLLLWNFMSEINQLFPYLENSTPPCLFVRALRKTLLKEIKQIKHKSNLFRCSQPQEAGSYQYEDVREDIKKTYASFLFALETYIPSCLSAKVLPALIEFKRNFRAQLKNPLRPPFKKPFLNRTKTMKGLTLTLKEKIQKEFQASNQAEEGASITHMVNLLCVKFDDYSKCIFSWALKKGNKKTIRILKKTYPHLLEN